MLDHKRIARKLRRDQTYSERVFWGAVRNRQFLNLKITRQHPVRYRFETINRFFVLDFYCAKYRLAIEIDGASHRYRQEYDRFRESILHEKGIEVIRFTNKEIIEYLEAVLATLKTHISKKSPLSGKRGGWG